MKAIFGIVWFLFALQAAAATDAEDAADKIISANPDIDQGELERLKKNIGFGAGLKPSNTVDVPGLGDRFDGEANVAPVRHNISDELTPVGGGSGLVVRTYPGSTPVVHADEDNHDRRWKIADAGQVFTGDTRSYLSKDSLDTIRAYYDNEVGKMQSGSLSYLTEPEGMRSENGDPPDPYTYAYPVGRVAFVGLIGVEVRALKPIEDHFIRYPIVGPIFDRLNFGVGSRDTSKEKFDSLVDEYKHLAWMYYPVSEQRSGHGRLLSTDEVVFDGCEKEAGGGMSPEEMQAKMQQLMAEGKMQEMLQLSEKMMGAGGASGVGSEDIWIECLKEMEGQGYNTLIAIHVGPAQSN